MDLMDFSMALGDMLSTETLLPRSMTPLNQWNYASNDRKKLDINDPTGSVAQLTIISPLVLGMNPFHTMPVPFFVTTVALPGIETSEFDREQGKVEYAQEVNSRSSAGGHAREARPFRCVAAPEIRSSLRSKVQMGLRSSHREAHVFRQGNLERRTCIVHG